MTTAVKAIYENGVFNPKEQVNLQERTEVEVLVPTQATSDDDPTGWAAVQALIGLSTTRRPTWPNITTITCTADRASDLRRR